MLRVITLLVVFPIAFEYPLEALVDRDVGVHDTAETAWASSPQITADISQRIEGVLVQPTKLEIPIILIKLIARVFRLSVSLRRVRVALDKIQLSLSQRLPMLLLWCRRHVRLYRI
jgi:hypothetical protein